MTNIPLAKDFANIGAYAQEACVKFGLKEVCSEVLLFAIVDDMNCATYSALTEAGYNANKLKAQLREGFKKRSAAQDDKREKPLSVSVEGLFALHAIQYSGMPLNTMSVLRTIIRNNNTSAARLLHSQHIKLNKQNELIYQPSF